MGCWILFLGDKNQAETMGHPGLFTVEDIQYTVEMAAVRDYPHLKRYHVEVTPEQLPGKTNVSGDCGYC